MPGSCSIQTNTEGTEQRTVGLMFCADTVERLILCGCGQKAVQHHVNVIIITIIIYYLLLSIIIIIIINNICTKSTPTDPLFSFPGNSSAIRLPTVLHFALSLCNATRQPSNVCYQYLMILLSFFLFPL